MKLTYLLPKFTREKLSELACNLPSDFLRDDLLYVHGPGASKKNSSPSFCHRRTQSIS